MTPGRHRIARPVPTAMSGQRRARMASCSLGGSDAPLQTTKGLTSGLVGVDAAGLGPGDEGEDLLADLGADRLVGKVHRNLVTARP